MSFRPNFFKSAVRLRCDIEVLLRQFSGEWCRSNNKKEWKA